MATHRGTRRRERSVAIDDLVLDAAVPVIRELGPDDLNLSAVARAAGLTTGAVYARYENRQELLLDVWDRRASAALLRLVDLAIDINAADQQAAGEAGSLLVRRDPTAMAGIALLIAAPRVEELEESLLPQVRAWFDDSDRGRQARQALMVVAYILGALAFDAAMGSSKRDWATPLALAARRPLPAPKVKPVTGETDALLEVLGVDTGDAVRDQILEAMAVVVARSGLKRATTSRVARAAGYQQSAVFSLWPNRAALVAEFTEVALAGMGRATAPAGAQAVARESGQATQGLARILGPSFQRTRRLRLEFVLAAMSDEAVAAVVSRSDDVAVGAMAGQDPSARALAQAVRAVVLGLVILEETVGGCAGVDLTAPISALLAAAQPA